MSRFTLKSGFAALALIGALTATAHPGAAHAARSADAPVVAPAPVGDTGKECHVLRVELHGSLAAVGTCLDSQQPSAQSSAAPIQMRLLGQLQSGPRIRPHTVATDCTDVNDLAIYADAGQSGDRICFSGTGFVNLTDFLHGWGGIYGNWNDIASSWRAGIHFGTFYSDLNGEGRSYNFGRGSSGNFGDTVIGNDQLTSIKVGG